MSGSGTCLDVCTELGIECVSFDVAVGKDACNPRNFTGIGTFDFIWAHPPYFRQKKYTDDPRDLSNSPTVETFLNRFQLFIANCAAVLERGGKFAILMGDYCDWVEGFVPFVYHTKRLCFQNGLRQACTDIIRFSHGASSAKKVYRSSFIPGLHDVVTVVEKVT